MSDVVLKGEVHTSSKDEKEELKLLEGKDVLIYEGSEEDESINLDNLVRLFPIRVLFFILNGCNKSKDDVLTKAEDNDINIVPTRSADSEVFNDIENSDLLLRVSSVALFSGPILLAFFLPSYIAWDVSWRLIIVTVAVLIFTISGLSVPIYLRRKETDDRDEKIAEKIKDNYSDDKKLLCIIGENHLSGVKEILDEEDIDYDPVGSKATSSKYFKASPKIIFRLFVLYSVITVPLYLLLDLLQILI